MRLSAITDVGRQTFWKFLNLLHWVSELANIFIQFPLNDEFNSFPSIFSISSEPAVRGEISCSDISFQSPKMPSTTEIAQQFDSIEDTITAFSESLLHGPFCQLMWPSRSIRNSSEDQYD